MRCLGSWLGGGSGRAGRGLAKRGTHLNVGARRYFDDVRRVDADVEAEDHGHGGSLQTLFLPPLQAGKGVMQRVGHDAGTSCERQGAWPRCGVAEGGGKTRLGNDAELPIARRGLVRDGASQSMAVIAEKQGLHVPDDFAGCQTPGGRGLRRWTREG